MKLTGQCKKDFEKWFIKDIEYHRQGYHRWFNLLPFSMQYGVYVDFFDSLGLQIIINHSHFWQYSINPTNKHKSRMNSRHEARTESIKRANEIYNEA